MRLGYRLAAIASSLLFLLSFLAAPSLGNDTVKLSSDLIAYYEHNKSEETLNPHNIIGLSENILEVAALLRIELSGISGSVRISGKRETINETGNTSKKIELTKVSSRILITDSVQFVLSKKTMNLDGGYFFHPLDFFEDNRLLGDLSDKRGVETGFSMAGIDFLPTEWQLSLIYSDDSDSDVKDYNRKMRQFLARLRFVQDKMDGSIVLQKYEKSSIGIGGAVSLVPNNSLEIHVSGLLRPGRDRPINSRLYIDQFHEYDKDYYNRLLLGLQWTSESLVNCIFEYSYDSSGFSNGEWNKYSRYVDIHRTVQSSIKNLILSSDAALLSMGRQHHLYGRLALGGLPLKPEISSVIGIDGSGWVKLRATYAFGRGEIWGDLKHNYGSSKSEFGMSPSYVTATIGVRYSLDLF